MTVAHGDPSPAAGARTRYVVDFDVSASGGLSGSNQMTVTFPAGTGFTGYTGGTVLDVTSNTTVGSCGSPSGTVINCGLFGGQSIAAGDSVRITFSGITNPSPAGAYTLDVSTTADTSPSDLGPVQRGGRPPGVGAVGGRTATPRRPSGRAPST